MDSIIKQLAANMGIDTSSSSNRASGRKSTSSDLNLVASEIDCVPYNALSANIPAAKASAESDGTGILHQFFMAMVNHT